jgi:hypothetical protein
MADALGILVLLLVIAGAIGLGFRTQSDIKQLRSELDETQRLLNETRQQVEALKAAAEAQRVPPPLPRTRSVGLDDLREQLRAAHREQSAADDSDE